MSLHHHPIHCHQLIVGAALVGCTLASASETQAAIVVLDMSASGFAISTGNTGWPSNSIASAYNFPIAGMKLTLSSGFLGYWGLGTNSYGSNVFEFAINGGVTSPRNFSSSSAIDSTATFTTTDDTMFRAGSSVSADFGPGSFMGFRFSTDSGANWLYGWLEVTWSSATNTFTIPSGAYETNANTGILAGASGGGVPLPGAAGLAACGLLASARRRRR